MAHRVPTSTRVPRAARASSWVRVRSKKSWQRWMGWKSLANVLVLHPALVPESLPVPYAWKDQKITTIRCPSKKTEEIRGSGLLESYSQRKSAELWSGCLAMQIMPVPQTPLGCVQEEIQVSTNSSPEPRASKRPCSPNTSRLEDLRSSAFLESYVSVCQICSLQRLQHIRPIPCPPHQSAGKRGM